MPLKLPTSRQHVTDNIVAWDRSVRNIDGLSGTVQKSLMETITRTNSWLCIRRNDRWMAGPTKYCGGAIDMTPQKYDANRLDISGWEASAAAGKLFWPDGNAWSHAEISSPNHPAVRAIVGLAQSLGKTLRFDTKYYLLPGEDLSDDERQKIERLAQQIQAANLTDGARSVLAARIAA